MGGALSGFWSAFQLRPLLARNARLAGQARAAREVWEAALFHPRASGDPRLLDVRRRTATLHQMTRGAFYPLLFPRRPAAARST